MFKFKKLFNKDDTKWIDDFYAKVEKAYKSQNWPKEFYVNGKSPNMPWRSGLFDTVEHAVYNPETEASSVDDYYKRVDRWFPLEAYPLDVLKKAERNEKGRPSEVQELYIVNFKNKEELESFSRRVIYNGADADYYMLRSAFSKIIDVSQFKKDDIKKDDVCSIIDFSRVSTSTGVVNCTKIVIPHWFDNSKIFYQDGTPFDGDLLDFAIALNRRELTLKDLFNCYNSLKNEKVELDKESKEILSAFTTNTTSYMNELNESISDFEKALSGSQSL